MVLDKATLDKVMTKKRCDDDAVDRFNYWYTPAMLSVFCVLLAAKQYVGKPLQVGHFSHRTSLGSNKNQQHFKALEIAFSDKIAP